MLSPVSSILNDVDHKWQRILKFLFWCSFISCFICSCLRLLVAHRPSLVPSQEVRWTSISDVINEPVSPSLSFALGGSWNSAIVIDLPSAKFWLAFDICHLTFDIYPNLFIRLIADVLCKFVASFIRSVTGMEKVWLHTTTSSHIQSLMYTDK